MSVTLALLAAHALADFPLQPTWMAREKADVWPTRFLHCLIHGLVTAVLLYPVVGPSLAGTAASAILGLHFVIDTRRWAEPKDGFEAYPIAVDQALHLASLYLVSVVVL